MRERGQQVSDAEQTAQSIVGEFGLTAHIPLDPQCRVETEDAGSGGAAEILQAALVQPQAQIVVGLVGVNAPVPLGQILLQGQRVDILLHKVTVGVPLAELANADVDDAEQAAERQHTGQQAAGKDPALLPAPADAMVGGQTAQTKGKHCTVLARILQHAQAPLLGGGILHGHQCKGQRGDHHKGNAPGGAGEVEAGVLPRAHRHGRKDEHRHIEPPGIVAGIEGIERAVQDGHQRKYHADGNDPLFAVALPGTPVGHHTGQTAQGQIGCHAGPFDDALRPDGGHIGGIRGQHPAQQDGQILLGLGIGQKAPAGGKVDGARVLQHAEDSGPEHHKAQCHAQQALKGQLTEEAGREPKLPGGELADEVDDKEEHLPHKEKVVVEQVHRHPEGEPSVAALVNGLIQ